MESNIVTTSDNELILLAKAGSEQSLERWLNAIYRLFMALHCGIWESRRSRRCGPGGVRQGLAQLEEDRPGKEF